VSSGFKQLEAKLWLKWRRHLVMLAAASNDPTYVIENIFHAEGYYVSCPMDKEPEELAQNSYLGKERFAQSAQCRGHWYSYLDYYQEILKGPIELKNNKESSRELTNAMKKAMDIFYHQKRVWEELSKKFPEPTHIIETVNHVDSYRYPSEVFLLSFNYGQKVAINNPQIVLQVTMPVSTEVDPTQVLLEEFQAQYIKERFDEIKAIHDEDFLLVELDDLDPIHSLTLKFCDNREDYSKLEKASIYPLGVIFYIKNPEVSKSHIIGDLFALAIKMGAANVFFASNSSDLEKESLLMLRLRSLKYNMKHRPIVEISKGRGTPPDPTVRQILGSAGFGSTQIEIGQLEPGLSGASLHLVRYYRNALPTNWKVLKVGNWVKLYDEYRRYQMFVEDRLPTVWARLIPGPKDKDKGKTGIEYTLASTLAEDQPKSFADWILDATQGEEDIKKIIKAIDDLFGRILVSWDSSYRELPIKIKTEDISLNIFQVKDESVDESVSKKHEPDMCGNTYLGNTRDRRPYNLLVSEYIPFNLYRTIEEEVKEMPPDLRESLGKEIGEEVRNIKHSRTVEKVKESAPLKHVQSLKVCHGDLHARNILIDGQEALWVIDFGRTGLHHSLIDFVTLECSIRWWHCLWIDQGLINRTTREQEFESDLLKLEYWLHYKLIIEKYGKTDLSKYAAALATIRKHARKFCATSLPGLGFSEYLTCLGLKCITTIRNEPMEHAKWCDEATSIFTAAKSFLCRFP
jgi:hypothetical protein